MGVTAFLVRAEARRRWRTLAVLALLLGVVGGASMTAAAGARRTSTAYARLLQAENGEDVLVNPDDGFADFDAIEALPQVAGACRATGANAALAGPDGEPNFTTRHSPLVSDGHCLFDLSGPARVQGRLPDPAEPYEAFLSQPLADALGAGPGDTLDLLVFADEGEDSPPQPVQLTVTGSGVYGQDALLDPENEATYPVLLLTPAFAVRHPVDPEQTFSGSLVQLKGGKADLAAFGAAAIEAAGESMHLEDRWGNERKASRALEPYALALWLFALGVVVAGGGMLVGALHRTLAAVGADQRTLAALGVSPGARGTMPLVLGLGVGIGAAVTGVGLAVALSPLMPIGPAHEIEPSPGIAVDARVLLLGGLLTLAGATAVGAALAVRARRDTSPRALAQVGRLGRLGGLPAPASAGVRLATGELGGGRSAARTTIVGAALGVIAVLTVQLVGAGITRVVGTPARYGWDWDAMVTATEAELSHYVPTGGAVYDQAADELDRVGVTDRTTFSLGQVDVGGEVVAAVGLGEQRGTPVVPPLVRGTLPDADDEIVLGGSTLAQVDAEVGDVVTVRFGAERREMRVVGQATFPRLTEYPGAPNTGLGEGAMLTSSALTQLTGALPYVGFLIRFPDDSARSALLDDVEAASSFDGDADILVVERPQRPDALYGYESTTSVRQALAYLLGCLTVASVLLGLLAASRAARRDLAVLRAVGFTRGQTRWVMHLHGAVVGAVALFAGVPLGLVAGRTAWRGFASHLGVATDPVMPSTTVVVTGLLVLLVSIALTIPVAAAALRRAPAAVLRAE